MKPSVALIGPGRVGSAVCKRLLLAGYPITAVIGRDNERAKEACKFIGCPTAVASTQLLDSTTAQIILLAVPDDQIEPVAQQLQANNKLSPQTLLIHFSGLYPATIMAQNSSNATLLSLHPLLPFANCQIAFDKLAQCPCAIESDDQDALVLGEQLVEEIGGTHFIIACDKKVLYHSAACIASNYLVTLLASAQDLLVKCDIEKDQTVSLLLPLVQVSLDNVHQLGLEQGLTGPIVRGDVGTIAKHIEALQNNAPELLPIYQQLGKLTTALSQKSDRLDAARASTIRQLLKTDSNASAN